MKRRSKLSFIRLIAIIFFFSIFFAGCTTLTGTAGNAPADPEYRVVNDTVVVTEKTDPLVHWIFVKCDYWAGCYVRCEGSKNHCRKVATAVEPERHLEFSENKTDH